MGNTPFALSADGLSPSAGWRRHASNHLRRGMEVGLLVMVWFSPWALGASGPEFEFFLDAGIAILMVGWGARMLLAGQLSWKKCPVALCLAALTIYAVWELVPLPPSWLSRLSPATTRMVAQLLPTQEEILPFGEAREAPVSSIGSTLSLYPARTREELTSLLAVFLLFVVVRNNLASSGSLRRLSIATAVNGALLSLFALVQFFTSPPHTLYWTWPSAGTVFGPFVNRNHFAFYMNLCVGLSFGLLVGSKYFASGRGRENGDRGPSTILQDPAALWTIAGLVLMISSVAFSASRGGMVALLCGWIVFLLMNLLQSVQFRRVGAVVFILSLVLALLTWFGLGRVQERLSTLWAKEVLQESRLDLWSRVLPLVKDFPIWGTGYGTFQYLEPLVRSDPTNEVIYSNAENDYLEGLIEGGVVRLVLSLLAIGLVFRLGYRAVRSNQGHSSDALAMGALFGFTTMVVQSVVDFGLHMPAIAVLATVLCAHLCAASSPRNRRLENRGRKEATSKRKETAESSFLPDGANRDKEPVASDAYVLRLWGLAPVAGAALAVMFGLVLTYEGWRAYKIQELRVAASHPDAVVARSADNAPTADRSHQVECLAAAARLAPESARLQIELALAYYDGYREQRPKLELKGMLIDATRAWCDFIPVQSPIQVTHSALTAVPAWIGTSFARDELGKDDERQVTRKYLVPALRHLLQARDLCPLLPEPQRLIAENVEALQQADSRLAYLERARFLVPNDPGLWYWCGQELLDKQPEQTWKYWRRALELSDIYVSLILQQSAAHLSAREIRERVLPDDPKILHAAALQLYPQAPAERQFLLEQALVLLEKRPDLKKPEQLHLKALIQCDLDRSEEALASYQAALAKEPNQVSWRFEYAQLLVQHRRMQESRRELLTILLQQPEHALARELLTNVQRQIAEGK